MVEKWKRQKAPPSSSKRGCNFTDAGRALDYSTISPAKFVFFGAGLHDLSHLLGFNSEYLCDLHQLHARNQVAAITQVHQFYDTESKVYIDL